MPSYGTADSQERRIKTGKAPSTGSTRLNPRDVFTKVMDEYGQSTPIWQWSDPTTKAALAGYADYASSGQPLSGQGKWSDVNWIRQGIVQSGRTPSTGAPAVGGGSGDGGRAKLLEALAGIQDQGTKYIDDSTQRALDALKAIQNPYADLQMAAAPPIVDEMAAYAQATGTPTGGVDALRSMFDAQNAATGDAFNNLAKILAASQTAAQQSRIGDVNVARTSAQQDFLNQINSVKMAQLIKSLGG